jgi:predicted tellurium resistance membrane protein TerC
MQIMSASFSLDTVLTAIAWTEVFLVVVFAIVALGVSIVVMAKHMACFFEHN